MSDARAIRVFVSSTFRDMQAERDELVKRVFPLLRRRCQERGVAWSEVDLRWGVTDEQASDGAVLPICLAEIERTRPYFIGLLGQRYGWVPDSIGPELAARLGWLTEDLHRSVTELEILHGGLNDPDADGHAYFYLRDPAWVAALPADQQALYVEPDAEGAARLEALRERVRGSGFPVAGYGDPEALGERVLADLEALIDRLFPAAQVPAAAARAASVHEAFGRARFALNVPRPALSVALEAAGSPLLVTGEPGCGASSLVTTWASEWAAAHPGATVVVHHCDADAAASDFRLLAARGREQTATAGRFKAFHDFTFTNRVAESGITFEHRSVDDALKTWKGVHYDHGSAVAVAPAVTVSASPARIFVLAGIERVGRTAGLPLLS